MVDNTPTGLATVPIAPPEFLATKFNVFAVTTLEAGSVNDPAFNVTVLAPKFTAPPTFKIPVLAAESPIAIVPAPVTPPANEVTSLAVKSKVDAPARDIVVAALEGLSVKAPVVMKALLPVFVAIVTASPVIVIAPVPDVISKSFCA